MKQFLRLPQVKQRVGLGRTTIYEKIKAGDFPRPVSLGPQAVAWLSSEVEEWMEERITESRAS
jgi:prophage regulatory protein